MPCGKGFGGLTAWKRMPVAAMVLPALFLISGESKALSDIEIVLSSSRIAQGECGTVLVRTEKGKQPYVRWLGGPVFLVPESEGKGWYGFLGVDLSADPGKAYLEVDLSPSGEKQRAELTVVAKDWGVRVLTLPKAMVEPDKKTMDRVKKESRIMEETLKTPSSAPRWNGPFKRPLEGEVVGPFGRRSIINELPRSPHSGVDLRAAKGTPVQSIHNGKVVLVGEHFFSGKSVVIDHGGAIQSMYFHLEKILVEKGEEVAGGQVIGLVGATGRATGPHLHFGMRVNGARVDPMQVILLSEQMGRP
ncbi:MAG: peptidoglycan DD-metalloendopeptidase family protein [Deltaproteobacteria bacterium]|nr:peptidoglycan DD-metalloendopeptidase family protein [Deltaproteobacteria bacterium]